MCLMICPCVCSVCSCSVGSVSSVCNQLTGQCVCRPNVEGLACDRCAAGYWNPSSPNGCQPCDCDPINARSATCDQVHTVTHIITHTHTHRRFLRVFLRGLAYGSVSVSSWHRGPDLQRLPWQHIRKSTDWLQTWVFPADTNTTFAPFTRQQLTI